MRAQPVVAMGMVGAMLMVASCGSNAGTLESDAEYNTNPTPQATAVNAVTDRCTQMGLDVLASSDETTVFSPVSWCLALGMLAVGTSGEARTQVEQALGAPVDDAAEVLGSWAVLFDANDGDPGSVDQKPPEEPLVHQADQVVVQDGFPVNQEYLDSLKQYFDTQAQQVDFAHDGKQVLDAWVKEHTGGRIEQSGIKPTVSTILVLQDALFFAASWLENMDKAASRKFTPAKGAPHSVPYFAAMSSFDYADVDGWTAVRLPMGDGYQVTFILPPLTGQNLTPEVYDQLMSGFSLEQVEVELPEFNAATTTDLKPWMEHFNMGALLDSASMPLEEIAQGRDLFVTQAVQQAKLEVNKDGVIAAAVTEIAVSEGAAPMEPAISFIVDRPFFMLISHDSGLDLFQSFIADV